MKNENQDSQGHPLETVKNRKSEDQLERQFIAQTCCGHKRINSGKTSNNAKDHSCRGEGKKKTGLNKDLNLSKGRLKYEVADVWQIFFIFKAGYHVPRKFFIMLFM